MNAWWRWGRLTTALVLVVALFFAVPVRSDPTDSMVVRCTISALMLAALAYAIVIQIRHQLDADDRRIDGLVLAVALGVFVFALGFYVIAQRSPSEIAGLHTRLDALYFTMSTVLTIGYGDVHAEGQMARGVVLVQMVFNVVVLAAAATTLNARVRRTAASRAASRRERHEDTS